MKKKLFVLSDVHGHCAQMLQALEQAGFDKENPEHILICCGDYFDRGRENRQVMRFFQRLKHCVLLRGNHEDMLLKILATGKMEPHNFINGTANTICEFFGKYAIDPVDNSIDFSGKNGEVQSLTEFLEQTIDYYETRHYIFVHGWLPTRETEQGHQVLPDWRRADGAVWARARWTKWHLVFQKCGAMPDKTLVCGHVPSFYAAQVDPARDQKDASVYHGPGFIAIDGGTYTSGQVNVLVLEDALLR